ncbi:MAG: protein-export chaperone SecB [Pseudomonadota bacterium]|nr:protein-export chaperone SecB [Pseudomonadota bacterium]
MATAHPNNGNAGENTKRQLQLQRIYVKDASFEAPSVPSAFLNQVNPNIQVDLDHQVDELTNNQYQVVLRITVTATHEEKTVFLAEVHQAGLFRIEGLNPQEMGAVLGAYCPNTLFPYAREAISSLVSRGGFPQLLLAPVNFDALYAQRLQQSPKAGTS